MKIALVAVLALIVGAFVLVWFNRASEKVVTTVIPISVAAVTGILLSVFVFGSEPPIEEVFASGFIYELDTKMPPSLPWLLSSRRFTSALFAPAALFKEHPEFFNDQSGDAGPTLYHHLLQKALIDWIGMRYRGSWQTEILTFDLPIGREIRFQPAQPASPEPSEILTAEEIGKRLRGNKFAGVNTGIPPRLALPPRATLTVKPPAVERGGLEVGQLRIENWFCTVSIRTEESGGYSSIGFYQRVAGLSDEANRNLWTATYIVRFKAQFSRWLSGNPEVPKYRRWARQLVDGMKSQFDEELIWKGIRDDYLLLRASEPPRAQP